MIISKRIPLTYIIKKIWVRILGVVIFATTVYVLSIYVDLPKVPSTIPTVLGTAISLVLAFKLGQSYDRWWEARKIWGAIVNDSRTLVIQAIHFSGDDRKFKKIAHRQIAWCHALGHALRKQEVMPSVDTYISPKEKDRVQLHANIPLAILNEHSKDISKWYSEGVIDTYQHIQIDTTVQRLCASMGKAERIKNTVFPTMYRMYLHFFIYLFMALFSISLVELEGASIIILSFLISIPFFMLEKTANLLQDPFENKPTDTPMTAIAITIETNLKQLIEDDSIPFAAKPQKYYVL